MTEPRDQSQQVFTPIDSDSFPYLSAQAGLRAFWHPVAFSHAIGVGKSVRRIAFGVPLLIWRTAEATVSGFLDICPHRQAQLSQGTTTGQEVTCPYHGWRFGVTGNCSHIPVAPCDQQPRNMPTLTRFPVSEHGGMIWVWLGQNPPTQPPTDLESYPQNDGWRFSRIRRTFPFDLDDLIENFMDVAHTPIVHPGLIRGISSARQRGVTIETRSDLVVATHDPVDEKIGWLSGLVLPRKTGATLGYISNARQRPSRLLVR